MIEEGRHVGIVKNTVQGLELCHHTNSLTLCHPDPRVADPFLGPWGGGR